MIDRRLLSRDHYGLDEVMPLAVGLSVNFRISAYTDSKILNNQQRMRDLQVFSAEKIDYIRGSPMTSNFFSQRDNLT